VSPSGSLSIVGGLVLRSTAVEPERLDVIVRDGRVAALNPPGAPLPPDFRRDYRDHFDRLAPVVASIAALVAEASARPLPYTRWASAGDGWPHARP
jgi:hypothetical protein